MIRKLWLSGGLSVALPAIAMLAAQASAEAPVSTYCPRGPVTVYFASGVATATPQVEALIGKISDTAASCEADRIDLVAHIDPGIDGEGAASVALERLKLMMRDLVARGLPVDRIRFAAQAPVEGEPAARFSQVDVMFRKADIDDPAPVQDRIATDAI
jgi:hypothetical protein